MRFINLCPEGELEIPSNKLYPFEIDIIYDQGIDFDKGCFIGQEVIARVKYKGSLKKKYISFKINSSEIIDNENINDINKNIVGLLIRRTPSGQPGVMKLFQKSLRTVSYTHLTLPTTIAV